MQRGSEQISAVESHLAYWLHYVGYRLSHELGRKARRSGVTAAEWWFCANSMSMVRCRLIWRCALA